MPPPQWYAWPEAGTLLMLQYVEAQIRRGPQRSSYYKKCGFILFVWAVYLNE